MKFWDAMKIFTLPFIVILILIDIGIKLIKLACEGEFVMVDLIGTKRKECR